MRSVYCLILALAWFSQARAQESIYIENVPDYQWFAGCFGTATGNLMGFWDRNGLPNCYTGPTGGGLAPLTDRGNTNIYALWASKAGLDGRPLDKPGHMDDYYASYENPGLDPFVTAGRAEHEPDCIGDFIGLSQRKWTNLNDECDGNIDAYSFVYWDAAGDRRVNFTPPADSGPPVDIQSGLRRWAAWRGYEADVFTQLTDFNPACPPGKGFTWEDLKAEINQGYPIMIFLQPTNATHRSLGSMPKANPEIHGMLIYGYRESSLTRLARYRTSWGSGDNRYWEWSASRWENLFSVRGVIGFRPHPKITRIARAAGQITLEWEGPASRVRDEFGGQSRSPHMYSVERSLTIAPANFIPIGSPTQAQSLSLTDDGKGGYFRVRLDHQ